MVDKRARLSRLILIDRDDGNQVLRLVSGSAQDQTKADGDEQRPDEREEQPGPHTGEQTQILDGQRDDSSHVSLSAVGR